MVARGRGSVEECATSSGVGHFGIDDIARLIAAPVPWSRGRRASVGERRRLGTIGLRFRVLDDHCFYVVYTAGCRF